MSIAESAEKILLDQMAHCPSGAKITLTSDFVDKGFGGEEPFNKWLSAQGWSAYFDKDNFRYEVRHA